MREEKISKVMISEEEIKKIVKKLGKDITEYYKNKNEPLVVVGLLRGSIIFMADLIREIKLPLKIDFMTVSSYGDSTSSSREVKIKKELDENIMNKNVLIVEDIIDSGITLNKIKQILQGREPSSIKICTFLSKPDRREINVEVDFIGMEIPDEFVVGYGLDFAQMYRNLPYVGIVKGE